MVDIVDQKTRSRMMAGIGPKNTKPELIVRRSLHSRGFRYRLHDRRFPGKPDIVLPKYRTVIFVHGCFWHRHEGCPKATTPATRPDFWKAKFRRNVERDQENREAVRRLGWRPLVVWECQLASGQLDETIDTLIASLTVE